MDVVEIPENHKTVFVIDHTPYFGISSDQELDFNQPDLIPLKSICKSLWTCSTEAVLEYSRIVWDLFTDKLILFSISDRTGRLLNDWDEKNQNVFRILNGFSYCGPPPRLNISTMGVDYSIIHGFRGALEAVCQCSDFQLKLRNTMMMGTNIPNPCRFICITSTRDDECIKNLEGQFYNDLETVNRVAKNSKHLMPITRCNFLIINTHPLNTKTTVRGHGPIQVYPILTTEAIRVPCGDDLTNKLLDLVVQHYGLASTTITGIPMKEEQNAGSSANYDVEMYHLAEVHKSIFSTKSINVKQLRTPKPKNNYQMITLKWCTPRAGSSVGIGGSSGLYKVTPSDASSRQSNCLISFIVNGRTVMLETVRTDGSQIITHFLSGISGEVFMHTINLGHDIFDDLPTMDEGLGSRVPDYRLDDLSDFLKTRLLVPLRDRYFQECSERNTELKLPFEQALEELEKDTKFWQLTESRNLIFRMKKYTEPLLTLLRNPELTEEDILRCKSCICILCLMNVQKIEIFPPPLHSSSGIKKLKFKKSEKYQTMWSEIVAYMKTYKRSPDHENILNFLYESRKKSESTLLIEKFDLERCIKQFEDEKKRNPTVQKRDSVIRATTDSPSSPSPSTSQQKTKIPTVIPDLSVPKKTELPKSVFQIWHEKTFTPEMLVSIPPYAGLRNSYKITKEGGFYARTFPHLPSSSDDSDEEEMMEIDCKKSK